VELALEQSVCRTDGFALDGKVASSTLQKHRSDISSGTTSKQSKRKADLGEVQLLPVCLAKDSAR
jgi:hypothetical protein